MKADISPNGFTLAETLITLVIVGVVAALTVPNIIEKYQWKQFRAGALKAIGNLNKAVILYQAKEGNAPGCAYLYNSNYGNFSDCNSLYNFFVNNMNIVKSCSNNAYINGCIPNYNGIDTIYQSNNSNLTSSEVSDIIGGRGFKKKQIDNTSAFITADGVIYFTFMPGDPQLIAFDLNGFKGPNKWGYDVFAIIPQIKKAEDTPKYSYQYAKDLLMENGGKTLDDLIYKNY